MNQILATEPIKRKKPVDIHKIAKFFAISLIVFGVCLISSGSYAVFKNQKNNTKSMPQQVEENKNVEETNQANSGINIHLSVVGTNIQATITGESEISYVTYKFDDQEETRQDIGNLSGEITIEIPEGQHTLIVTAVDVNNDTETKEQQVKGVTKPKVTVKQEGQEFVINASDEIGLDKIEFILNGQGYLVRVEGATDKEFRYPLEQGDNTLEVTAYNVDGATGEFNAICHN